MTPGTLLGVRCRSQSFRLGPANATLLVNSSCLQERRLCDACQQAEAHMEDYKIPSPEEQRSEFQVELRLVTMPGVVVNAWVRPGNRKETSVRMNFSLSESES